MTLIDLAGLSVCSRSMCNFTAGKLESGIRDEGISWGNGKLNWKRHMHMIEQQFVQRWVSLLSGATPACHQCRPYHGVWSRPDTDFWLMQLERCRLDLTGTCCTIHCDNFQSNLKRCPTPGWKVGRVERCGSFTYRHHGNCRCRSTQIAWAWLLDMRLLKHACLKFNI